MVVNVGTKNVYIFKQLDEEDEGQNNTRRFLDYSIQVRVQFADYRHE
jgi:hypothetical protein